MTFLPGVDTKFWDTELWGHASRVPSIPSNRSTASGKPSRLIYHGDKQEYSVWHHKLREYKNCVISVLRSMCLHIMLCEITESVEKSEQMTSQVIS